MALASSQVHFSPLMQETEQFFRRLEQTDRGRKLLAENLHQIEFDVADDSAFWLEIRNGQLLVHVGHVEPRQFDNPGLIHFRLTASTLRKLLRGEIRFTDGLIPTGPDGEDSILLLECTLFKWSILSWVGRMIRTAQTTNA
jgi:hypothetical protein